MSTLESECVPGSSTGIIDGNSGQHHSSDANSSQHPESAGQEPRMHKYLLYILPRQYEQAYYAQEFQVLDLVYCLATPCFLVMYMSLFKSKLVSAVYNLVLLIKGFHLAILLLPAARHAGAHAKYRYWLILTDRLLRQCVAGVLVMRAGPHSQEFGLRMAQTNRDAFLIAKMLLMISGLHWVCMNTFMLPLDIRSQVVVNCLWFGIVFPRAAAQVAYPMEVLVQNVPSLVWGQWLLEFACSSVAQSVAQVAAWILRSSCGGRRDSSAQLSTTGALFSASAGGRLSESAACSAEQLPLRSLAAEAVATPAGPSPDLTSTAGRLTLALSTCYMLLVVLVLPLAISWRLERHLKSKRLAAHASGAHGQQPAAPGQPHRSSGGVAPDSHTGPVGGPSLQQCLSRGVSEHREQPCLARQQPSKFCAPLAVLPFLVQPVQLCVLLGVLCGACFTLAEAFVLLCVHSRTVSGLLAVQVIGVRT